MKKLFFCDFRNRIFKNKNYSFDSAFSKIDENMSSYLPYESSLLKSYFTKKGYFVKNYDFDILFKDYLENNNLNISFDENEVIEHLLNKKKKYFKIYDFLSSFNFKSNDTVFFNISQEDDIYMILLFCKYLKKIFNVKIILYADNLDLDELVKIDYDSLILNWSFKKLENSIEKYCREKQLNLEFSIIPDFSDYSKELYIKYTGAYRLPIKFQSGCNYNCAFCSWDREKPIYQDANEVVQKLKKLQETYKPDYFVFKNNAINMDDKYLEDFLDLLIKEDINIKYSALAIVKKTSKAIIKKLFLSGCKFIGLGLEHCDKEILRLMNKPTDINSFKELFKNYKNYGISIMIFYIIDFPGENEESIKKTLDFLKKYKENIVFRDFILLKDSEIFKKLVNFKTTKNLLGVKNYQLNTKSYMKKIKMISKNILIINGSPRVGNTNKVVSIIDKLYYKNNINYEVIDIKNISIKYCKGCFDNCYSSEKCIYPDMDEIMNKMDLADGIIFVIPTYLGGIHSMFRNFMERTSPLIAKYMKNKNLQSNNSKKISIISLGNNTNSNEKIIRKLVYEEYCNYFGWKIINFKYYQIEINLGENYKTISDSYPNLIKELSQIAKNILK